jgi:hypothetical protein
MRGISASILPRGWLAAANPAAGCGSTSRDVQQCRRCRFGFGACAPAVLLVGSVVCLLTRGVSAKNLIRMWYRIPNGQPGPSTSTSPKRHGTKRPDPIRHDDIFVSCRAIVPQWRPKHDTKETFSCRVMPRHDGNTTGTKGHSSSSCRARSGWG